MFKSGCASIYLCRSCPRKCPYCSVVNPDKEKKRLSVEEWKKAFKILSANGIKFFLIIGSEPLAMGEDLIELVKFWKKQKYEYGLYTTSPVKLFEKYKNKLVEAGLRNWSSGIDFIPEVYEVNKWRLSDKCKELVEREKDGLIKKAQEGLAGMQFMTDKKVEELHILITISRMNIEMIPDMIRFLANRFDSNVRIAMNYVEYGGRDMDFAPEYEQCKEYALNKEDYPLWEKFILDLTDLDEMFRLRVQVPFGYLPNFEYVCKLNRLGNEKYCAISVDCDGSLRKCGYRKGTESNSKGFSLTNYSVLDIPKKKKEILELFEKDVKACEGCFWVFPWMLEYSGQDVVDYRSEYWQKRKKKFEELKND